jgi:hypothetical protein
MNRKRPVANSPAALGSPHLDSDLSSAPKKNKQQCLCRFISASGRNCTLCIPHQVKEAGEQHSRANSDMEEACALIECDKQQPLMTLPLQARTNTVPRKLASGVYSLPAPTESHRCILNSFFEKLVSFTTDNMNKWGPTNAIPRGRQSRPNERLEIDLGQLWQLLAPSLRPNLRCGTQHPLLQSNLEEARAVMDILASLLEQYQTALRLIGAADLVSNSWTFYAYCLYTQARTPAQAEHADNAGQKRDSYYTMLWPVSNSAELTQFKGPGYFSTPGLVLFDGHVLHRGPTVGQHSRLVLSMVASSSSKGGDKNHDGAHQIHCRKREGYELSAGYPNLAVGDSQATLVPTAAIEPLPDAQLMEQGNILVCKYCQEQSVST